MLQDVARLYHGCTIEVIPYERITVENILYIFKAGAGNLLNEHTNESELLNRFVKHLKTNLKISDQFMIECANRTKVLRAFLELLINKV